MGWNELAEFFIPSAVLDAASTNPDTGFITKPVNPLNPPIKNPDIPYFSAPSIGFLKRPTTPLLKPLAMLFAPLLSPSKTLSLLWLLSFYLLRLKSSSSIKLDNPFPIDPVKD